MGVGSVVGVGSGVGALDSGFLCVGVAALSLSSFTPSKGVIHVHCPAVAGLVQLQLDESSYN